MHRLNYTEQESKKKKKKLFLILTYLWPWNKVKVIKPGIHCWTQSKNITMQNLKDLPLLA